jgi:hypothetical protein
MLLLTMASEYHGLAISACLKAHLVTAIDNVLDKFTNGLARQVAHIHIQLSKAIKDAIIILEPAKLLDHCNTRSLSCGAL